jgi:hypothetical protein
MAASIRGAERTESAGPASIGPKTNEALPQTVEHVGIYADVSV